VTFRGSITSKIALGTCLGPRFSQTRVQANCRHLCSGEESEKCGGKIQKRHRDSERGTYVCFDPLFLMVYWSVVCSIRHGF
jgi:hypothetical protein